MEKFFRDLASRAATFDELLGPDFEPTLADKSTTDLSVSRLAAWCRSCANGDWAQFGRRLALEGRDFEQVLTRFSGAHPKASGAPQWLVDAVWIDQEMRAPVGSDGSRLSQSGTPGEQPFLELTLPIVERASSLVWDGLAFKTPQVTPSALDSLREMLLFDLSELCSPVLYERFDAYRTTRHRSAADESSRQTYLEFVDIMKRAGLRDLFGEKPVLLRLIAVLTRQWIDTTREFLLRLSADAVEISNKLLGLTSLPPISKFEGSRSDRHNSGRTVLFIEFENGARVVYKPKDLNVDGTWKRMVERLNSDRPPIDLKAPQVIVRENYGWTEFVQHTGCRDSLEISRYFRRAGAWLSLLHRFVAADMHQENIIASGEHPIPIDLETVFHTRGDEDDDLKDGAQGLARHLLANSVMMVGLLPAYGRSPFNRVFAVGGLTSGWTRRTRVAWKNVNSDAMRPVKIDEDAGTNPNLPHIQGKYAKFIDHRDEFVAGFRDYAEFLSTRQSFVKSALAEFTGMQIRTVFRPTRFYYMLQQRLRNHKTMHDGVIWSAQADFLARLRNPSFDGESQIQQKEREALLSLNIPHFTSSTDRNEISDRTGLRVETAGVPGLVRALKRCEKYDLREILWQIEVITENSRPALQSSRPSQRDLPPDHDAVAKLDRIALDEANRIFEEISLHAIRKDGEAAWIGREWFEDAEAFQLACLGPDLYNGSTGIALFLAAHSKTTGSEASKELSLASVKRLRRILRGSDGARLARTMGVGGAVGFSSIPYGLINLATLLSDSSLREDALQAACLLTPEIIQADTRLDVIGGSAGAILCLLRVYRDTASPEVLQRAIACGEHLLKQARSGAAGMRTWVCTGAGNKALNGMSHGAAGFAFALAALFAATSDQRFAEAAQEAVAFENNSYNPDRKNWPDFRREGGWSVRWCHGAPGIGLARSAMAKMSGVARPEWLKDIAHAAECTEISWTGDVDTLCCGSLGNIEFLRTAAAALDRDEVKRFAAKALIDVISSAREAGDYRWNGGPKKFNLGLFRGLAGVGYTCLRELKSDLPNVLVWE